MDYYNDYYNIIDLEINNVKFLSSYYKV